MLVNGGAMKKIFVSAVQQFVVGNSCDKINQFQFNWTRAKIHEPLDKTQGDLNPPRII